MKNVFCTISGLAIVSCMHLCAMRPQYPHYANDKNEQETHYDRLEAYNRGGMRCLELAEKRLQEISKEIMGGRSQEGLQHSFELQHGPIGSTPAQSEEQQEQLATEEDYQLQQCLRKTAMDLELAKEELRKKSRRIMEKKSQEGLQHSFEFQHGPSSSTPAQPEEQQEQLAIKQQDYQQRGHLQSLTPEQIEQVKQ